LEIKKETVETLQRSRKLWFAALANFAWCPLVVTLQSVSRDVVLTKELWERTQKLAI